MQVAKPDILALLDIDYDHDGVALEALADSIGDFPHRFAFRPNRGIDTGRDLDSDGRLGEPEDMVGFAEFSGQGGMAVLSRLPISYQAAKNFSSTPWGGLPRALNDREDIDLPLSTTGHWDVPVRLLDGSELHLLMWHATPPVFDGPDDRNGRRNHDEAAFWQEYLNGAFGGVSPIQFVLAGGANLDPADGDGRPEAINALLSHPEVTDPQPMSQGGIEAAEVQGGVNTRHIGSPALDTADWPDEGASAPGNLRVDYLLPSRSFRVIGSGVVWPEGDTSLGRYVSRASRHRLVWVDIEIETTGNSGERVSGAELGQSLME